MSVQSTITLKHDLPNPGKEIGVNHLFNNNTYVYHFNMIQRQMPKETNPAEVGWAAFNVSFKDMLMGVALRDLQAYFEFNITKEEHDKIYAFFKSNQPPNQQTTPQIETQLNEVTDNYIKKELIFQYMATHWKIDITDEQVTNSLHDFYKKTNQSIKKYFDDKQEFEKIRKQLITQKVFDRILNLYDFKFNLKFNLANSTPEQKTS